MHDDNYAEEVFNTLQTKLLKVFSESSSPESTELAAKHIISIAGQPTHNDEAVDILMKILEKLVLGANVSPRYACKPIEKTEKYIQNSDLKQCFFIKFAG